MFIRTESFSQYIRQYPVVTTLIALNVIIYLLTLMPFFGDSILNFGIGSNYMIEQGEYWRLVTPMFLHAGFMHLLFNMFSLFIFGPELEKVAGKARFLTVYFLAGIFGDIATFFVYDSIICTLALVVPSLGFSVHLLHWSITRKKRCLSFAKSYYQLSGLVLS